MKAFKRELWTCLECGTDYGKKEEADECCSFDINKVFVPLTEREVKCICNYGDKRLKFTVGKYDRFFTKKEQKKFNIDKCGNSIKFLKADVLECLKQFKEEIDNCLKEEEDWSKSFVTGETEYLSVFNFLNRLEKKFENCFGSVEEAKK